MKELVAKKSTEIIISSASKAWKYVHGLVNVYKPAGVKTVHVINSIKTNICKDLNAMELDEPQPMVQIDSEDNKNFQIKLVPNLAQHTLVTGPRYTHDTLKIMAADQLGNNTSGVMILGINEGSRKAYQLRNGAPIQTFHLTGRFGRSTETNFAGSLITSRSTYDHVTVGKLQGLLSSMQATYQQRMYELCGVDLQSQTAYELACQGIIRPEKTTQPVVYGIKHVAYNRHTFTIEVQTMNTSEKFLSAIIAEVALNLRTVAHCTQIRCTRYGYFTFEQSLLRSQWNLENILKNVNETMNIWETYPQMIGNRSISPLGYEKDVKIEEKS